MIILKLIILFTFVINLFPGVMCSCLKPRAKPYEFQNKWVTDCNGAQRVMNPQLQQAIFHVNTEARAQAIADQRDANIRASYARRLSHEPKGSKYKVRAWLET